MQIAMNGKQALALRDLINTNGYEEGELLLTEASRGDLYVAFDGASFTIDADGKTEEAG